MTSRREKLERVRKAEEAGTIVDSMAVRQALMARVHAREVTLAEAQAMLKAIKKTGLTRSMVYSGRDG